LFPSASIRQSVCLLHLYNYFPWEKILFPFTDGKTEALSCKAGFRLISLSPELFPNTCFYCLPFDLKSMVFPIDKWEEDPLNNLLRSSIVTSCLDSSVTKEMGSCLKLSKILKIMLVKL
jgi:hypothetical protein